MTYRRYGQWWSYVATLRENLAKAERLLPVAPTDAARRTHQRCIDTCRAHLADMERLWPSVPDDPDAPPPGA